MLFTLGRFELALILAVALLVIGVPLVTWLVARRPVPGPPRRSDS